MYLFFNWPCGLMVKALVLLTRDHSFGSGHVGNNQKSGFKSWQGRWGQLAMFEPRVWCKCATTSVKTKFNCVEAMLAACPTSLQDSSTRTSLQAQFFLLGAMGHSWLADLRRSATLLFQMGNGFRKVFWKYANVKLWCALTNVFVLT